jgi:multiple antibiotic resistance protein
MAPPQGLVAIVTLSASATNLMGVLAVMAAVLAVMALDLVVLLSADRILAWLPRAAMNVMMRIFGLHRLGVLASTGA